MEVTGGADYVLDRSSFSWPGSSATRVFTNADNFNTTDHIHAGQLSFTDFHNKRPQVKIYRGILDITGDYTNEVVGHVITLNAVLVDADGLVVSNRLWTVPGKRIADWIYGTSTGKVIQVSSFTNASISYAWVYGGTNVSGEGATAFCGRARCGRNRDDENAPPSPSCQTFVHRCGAARSSPGGV